MPTVSAGYLTVVILFMFVGMVVIGWLKYRKGYREGYWQGNFDGRVELIEELDEQHRKNYAESLERLKASGQISDDLYDKLKPLARPSTPSLL